MRPIFPLLHLALCLAGALLPSALRAAPATSATPLHMLETGDDSRGWNGVGRLNLAGKAFCTGSLIAPDLVLTAAHCLFDRATGKRLVPSQIEFLAGWRNGRAAAYRGARRAVVHPDYVFSDRREARDVNYDLGLIQLDRPIQLPSIRPFATGANPQDGASVGVVSYARDRAQAPSLQRACQVLGREQSVVVMNCSVDFGASGAPVFSIEGGVARVVSVIAAKARLHDRPVALGIAVEGPLQTLEADMARSENTRFVHAPASGAMPASGTRAGGAHFLRP